VFDESGPGTVRERTLGTGVRVLGDFDGGGAFDMTLGGDMPIKHLAVGGLDLTGFAAINVHDAVGRINRYWG